MPLDTIGGCAALSGVMTRLIRVEYAGAVYHVTARGNERKAIYRDNTDRWRFLETVEEAVTRFGGVVHASWLLSELLGDKLDSAADCTRASPESVRRGFERDNGQPIGCH